MIYIFPYLAVETNFLHEKSESYLSARNFKKLKAWCLFWGVERGRGKFLISSEQWNSLEQWSLNKFFTSKYLLPNEEKYEQHSRQDITTCSHLLLVKLMNLLLGLNILFDLSHTLICFHLLECSFFTKYWKCLFCEDHVCFYKIRTMGSNF